MNSKDFKPGDILQATRRKITEGFHPIVFVSGRSARNFIGAMITHHQDERRNRKMDSLHFENGYALDYDNSYLVRGRFIKPEEWGPFRKIGQLTPIGLEFVMKEITSQPEETFAKYFFRHTRSVI